MSVKVSLVVSTLGRSTELEQLFDSLDAQDFSDFEVIDTASPVEHVHRILALLSAIVRSES